MKKIALLIVLVLMTAGYVSAQSEEPVVLGSHYEKGDVLARVCVGVNSGGLVVVPGMEMIMGNFILSSSLPLDWGILAEGFAGFYNGDFYSGFAGYGTLHLGFSGSAIPFVDPLELFLGIGISIPIGICAVSGVQYHLNDGMSVFIEYNYMDGSNGCLGVQWKF